MIILRSNEEIGRIRKAGLIVALVLDKLRKCAKPGIETEKLKVLEKGSFEKFRKARLAVLQHDSQFKANHLISDFKIPSEFKIIEEVGL